MDMIDSLIRLAKHMLESRCFASIGGKEVQWVGRHFVDEGLCFFPKQKVGVGMSWSP